MPKSRRLHCTNGPPMQLTAVSTGPPTALPKAVGAFSPWGHALGALGNFQHKTMDRDHLCAGIQLPGLLDDLCFYSGPLGAEVTPKSTSIRLWAPTAQKVSLML